MSVIKIAVLVVMMSGSPEVPEVGVPPVVLSGRASFYNSPHGDHGLRGNGTMANGQPITPDGMTIASRTIPLGRWVLLEYRGRRVWAKSADRGPYGMTCPDGEWHLGVTPIEGCEYRGIADLNYPVAKKLLGDDMKHGLNRIKIRYYKDVGRQRLAFKE